MISSSYCSMWKFLNLFTAVCLYVYFSGHVSPCQPNPCNGGGSCEEHDNTFTCYCPTDRTGERCERRLSENDLRIPNFNGNSFVELLPMENPSHKVSVEIEFKAYNSEGILLFAQQDSKMGNDFISIHLKEGFVEFTFDLGTGPARIRHPRKIKLGQWHKVQAKRWHKWVLHLKKKYFNMQNFEKGHLSFRKSKKFFFVFHGGWKP